jgi:hypothetical protein
MPVPKQQIVQIRNRLFYLIAAANCDWPRDTALMQFQVRSSEFKLSLCFWLAIDSLKAEL